MAQTYPYNVEIRVKLDADGAKDGTNQVKSQFAELERAAKRFYGGAASEAEKSLRARIQTEQFAARQINQTQESVARQAEKTARECIRSEQLFQREIEKTHREIIRTQQLLERGARSPSRSNGFQNSFLGSFAGNLASDTLQRTAGLASDGAREVLRFSGTLEQSKIAFATFTGSTDTANQHLRDLVNFAKKTPFEIEGLVKSSQQMQALGFRSEQIIPILTDVGNAVAAAGGGNERLERVVRALSQIQAKGRVQSEELLQLAEAGVPSLKILQTELGKSAAEILDLVKKGEVGADQFQKAFQKFSQTNFGGLMQEQSRTFLGALTNIQDGLRITAGTAFEPLFKEIRRVAVRAADELETSSFSQVGDIITARLSETVGSAVRTVAKQGASEFGKQFQQDLSDIFSGKFDLNAALKRDLPAVSGVVEGLFGTNDVADSVAEIEAAILKDIRLERQRQGALSDTAKQARDSENALRALAAGTDASSQRAEKLADVYRESSNILSVFGNASRQAATMQKLLAIDVDATSTALGKQALQAAAAADALERTLQYQREDSARRFEATQAHEQAAQSLYERINAANESLTNNLYGFSAEQVENTRLNFEAQAFAGIEGLQAALARYNEVYKNFSDKQVTDERGKANKFLSDLTEQNTQAIEQAKLAYESLGEGANLGKLSAGAIETLRQEMERAAFVRQKSNTLTKEGLDLALAEIDAANGQVLKYTNLSEAKQREIAATEFYNTSLARYQEILRGNVPLTESERLQKELLTKGNTSLTESQQRLLESRAKEADAFKVASEAAKKYKEQTEDAFRQTKSFFSETLTSAIDGGWKGLLDSLRNRIQRFLVDMAADWLASRFFKLVSGREVPQNAGGGFSLGNLGALFGGLTGNSRPSTPPFVAQPTSFNAANPFVFNGSANTFNQLLTGGVNVNALGGGQSGRRVGGGFTLPLPFLNTQGAAKAPGFFGRGGFFGDKGFGFNGGTVVGVGALASLAGGLIGGRVGNTLSGFGTGAGTGAAIGSIVPGLGTLVGGLVGGGIGALLGLFGGGDPKRKQDKAAFPQFQSGLTDAFTQFEKLIRDVEALRINPPSQAIEQALQLRAEIAGSSSQFASKKYRRQAQTLINARLSEIDRRPGGLLDRLEKAVQKAEIDGERDRRILPEFASGALVKARQGGTVARIAERGFDEYVLSTDPRFRRENFALMSNFIRQTQPAAASAAPAQSNTVVNVQLVDCEISPTGKGNPRMYIESSDGKRQIIDLMKEANLNKDFVPQTR